MAYCKAAVILGLLLCVSACAALTSGELQLSGHVTPIYVGLTRLITCKWIGTESIVHLDWYMVGMQGIAFGTNYSENTIALSIGRIADVSWNGRIFMCKATTTNGRDVKKNFTLSVKELVHEVKITPPCLPCEDNSHTLTAGDNYTLMCTVKSDLPGTLKWVRIKNGGQVEVENTPTIKVSAQTAFGMITEISITFKYLLTSHAGRYVCVSILNNISQKSLSTRQLECAVKIKIPPPCVELISDSEAVTSKNFALTAFIEMHPAVDAPIDIDSSWYGHLSLEDAPRVTISNTSGGDPFYKRSVQFAPLNSSDEGTYFISTRVRALDSEYLCQSSYVNESIDISPTLFVTIDVVYTPPAGFNLLYPPNYKTNTDVTFICRAEGASGDVKYQWSTAKGKLPADSNSQTLTKTMLNSYDTGNYTCTATDANNSTGSISTEMQVIGLMVYIEVDYNLPAGCNNLPNPPYFRPATSVILTCRVEGASGPFTYQWSSSNPNIDVENSISPTVSETILTSDHAGNHTCDVTDGDENTGSSTIEMRLEGGGIFVVESRSHKNVPLANNSMVTINYRTIDFVCYTNSSGSDDGYIIFPYNRQFYDTQIRRISPSGIQFQNNNYRLPVYTGIYTCRLPDSNGKILDFNLGVYTSARAPYIYYYRYIDQSKNEINALLGVIEIKTRYYPPTNVTCKRNGEIVVAYPCMKKDGYEVMQVITNRRYSYYTTYIQIRNACDLVGRNVYTCTVENSAGRHSRNIRTYMKVKTDLSLENSTEPVYNETFVLTCTATITPPKAAVYLVQQPIIEWVGPADNVLSNSSGIIIGEQVALGNNVTRTLTFSSLKYEHKGQYACRTKCVEITSQSFTIKVIERAILQLKFGPLPHCSNWYKEKHLSRHIELDLRKAIEGILLKDCNNSCTLHHRLLTDQRFSCQTSTSCVTFRAALISSQDTMKVHDMVNALSGWLEADGTFLFNYNSRIRMRADRECPLTINSFCDPECEGRECLFRQNMTTPITG